jgi:hypothetical protein
MGWLSGWVGHRHWSAYMILIGLIGFGVATHPSLFGSLLILLLAAWLFFMREVAHAEGAAAVNDQRPAIDRRALIAAAVITIVTIVAMSKINWLAI